MRIEIIPAIDIIGGRCVRLSKGDFSTGKVYDQSPADMALRYADSGVGRIHLVDLDGAKQGSPANLRTVEQIASALSKHSCDVVLECGGGISSDDALRSVYDAGVLCAIIGSVAVRSSGLMRGWLRSFGPERIALGADVRGRNVAVKGWMEDSPVLLEDLVKEFLPDGLTQLICTDISKDGMLQGPAFGLYDELKAAFPELLITVSGGIGSMDDIVRLSDAGLPRVIVGKAIYEGRIKLEDIASWSQKG